MSTYLSLHYHFVFSTKNRVALITPDWREKLHDYLGGTIRKLDGTAEAIGGVADHVHILARLKATHCIADFMRELKKSSSNWAHATVGIRDFSWQEGYAAFTVSATAVGSVRSYIANQEKHHHKKTFIEELTDFLKQAGVEYDPKYLE